MVISPRIVMVHMNHYKWFTALLAELVEIGQTIIFSESAYPPEDKISNLLGREFATCMKKHDYHIIRASDENYFLVE